MISNQYVIITITCPVLLYFNRMAVQHLVNSLLHECMDKFLIKLYMKKTSRLVFPFEFTKLNAEKWWRPLLTSFQRLCCRSAGQGLSSTNDWTIWNGKSLLLCILQAVSCMTALPLWKSQFTIFMNLCSSFTIIVSNHFFKHSKKNKIWCRKSLCKGLLYFLPGTQRASWTCLCCYWWSSE